jgi:3-mercaptopyruvate sulfurtransferase SseA
MTTRREQPSGPSEIEQTMIDASVLFDCLDAVAVVNVGTRMGGADPSDAFERCHLPGARFIVLDGVVIDSRAPERYRGDRPAVVYCGSGVTACHNALAIEAVGLRGHGCTSVCGRGGQPIHADRLQRAPSRSQSSGGGSISGCWV